MVLLLARLTIETRMLMPTGPIDIVMRLNIYYGASFQVEVVLDERGYFLCFWPEIVGPHFRD
jgi:hypothetical protein